MFRALAVVLVVTGVAAAQVVEAFDLRGVRAAPDRVDLIAYPRAAGA